jgi:predicted DNA-binding protein
MIKTENLNCRLTIEQSSALDALSLKIDNTKSNLVRFVLKKFLTEINTSPSLFALVREELS